MSMDLKRQEFSTEPKYFIAGTRIGITTATKEAAADIEAHAPVLLADGKVSPIAKVDSSHALSLTGLYGVAADSVTSGGEAVIFLTGEFFGDALVLPEGVKVTDVEVPLRNLGIFLK